MKVTKRLACTKMTELAVFAVVLYLPALLHNAQQLFVTGDSAYILPALAWSIVVSFLVFTGVCNYRSERGRAKRDDKRDLYHPCKR